MALKKPSDFFREDDKSDDTIHELVKRPELQSFSEAFSAYKNNLDKLDNLTDTIKYVEDIKSEIQDFIKKEDLDNSMMGYTFLLEESIIKLKNDVTGINEKTLTTIKSNVSNLAEKINNFVDVEAPKYKKYILESEIKSSIDAEEVKNLKISINEDLEVYEDHKNNIENKISDLEIEITKSKKNLKENLEEQNQEFLQVKKDIRNDFYYFHEEFKTVVNKLNLDELEEKNIQLSNKVKYLEKIFEKFNEKEFLNEGLINITPESDNSDPLTPLDKKYVTLDQLQDHYRIFVSRVQQQLATLGGSGETRLKYLDDIVGIATNASAYDGGYLRYDDSLKKFTFGSNADGNSWIQGVDGPYSLGRVGIGTTIIQSGLYPDNALVVEGNARITGILTIGTASITLNADTGSISSGDVEVVSAGGGANFTGIVTAAGANFNGNVTIGGTLIYDDVKNVDSIGIITAREGIHVIAGAGISIAAGGLEVTSGIATISDTLKVGTAITAHAGVITATTFDGSLATSNLTGTITNSQIENTSMNFGDVVLDLGEEDTTPAFNLVDAINYPYTSLTGIVTHIVGDTTPQLGGDLDGNNKSIYGVGVLTTTQIADGNGSVGSASSILSSTGTGLSWVEQSSGGTPGGSNTQIQFNNSSSFGGSVNLTFDGTTVTGTISTSTNAKGLINSPDITVGNIVGTALSVSGITTVTDTLKVGTAITAHAGIITANTFKGDLTGNVTGNLAGNADTATTAGTVTTAAQTNITSLGTLTSLSVSGDVSIGGTLTYDDVTNIDSVGLVTARSGVVVVGGGVSIAAGGLEVTSGITTVGFATASDVWVSGAVTATTFYGDLATTNLSGQITNAQLAGSIANGKLANSTVSYGGISLALGGSDATPAFDLEDATNYPFTSLTGIVTHIVGDTTPQLGGYLDLNSKGIYGVGVITATDFNSTSDIKLKTNIQPIDDPLAKVIQIEGVSFNWKYDNKPALGVVADQIENILPELVQGDDPKTVNYNGLIGLLIEAVKEQQTQIDNLKERISKLE
tara:strand:- start:5261 stop:8353 length:3093 start_codon:yes stop_codon:yes gene_type:complete